MNERTQGETEGPDQEPTQAGDQDPATRAPDPDGPMAQPVDPADGAEEAAESPDAVYGQREGQADPQKTNPS